LTEIFKEIEQNKMMISSKVKASFGLSPEDKERFTN